MGESLFNLQHLVHMTKMLKVISDICTSTIVVKSGRISDREQRVWSGIR